MEHKINKRLQQIANALIINASNIDDIGLLNGRMGIAIFFYHYSSYSNNNLYRKYADELIDEIYSDIHQSLPMNFTGGLTGIGWAIEYLVKNRFVSANTDEILIDIDNATLKYRLENPVLINKKDIFWGIGLYQLARFKNTKSEELIKLRKKEALIYLLDECERLITQSTFVKIGLTELSSCFCNSLLYFLSEVSKTKLLPIKVENIIRITINNHISSIFKDNIDKAFFMNILYQKNKLIHNIVSNQVNSDFRTNSINKNADKELKNSNEIVNEFTKIAYYSLIYDPKFSYKNNEATNFILEDSWWNMFINNLTIYNLGLHNGLAGIGIGLLLKLKVIKK